MTGGNDESMCSHTRQLVLPLALVFFIVTAQPALAQQLRTGACCLVDQCLEITGSECADASGLYLGDGSSCDQYDCGDTGACCYQGGGCEDDTVLGCYLSGGTFRGWDTACASTDCSPPAVGACCVAGDCLIENSHTCAAIPGEPAGRRLLLSRYRCCSLL